MISGAATAETSEVASRSWIAKLQKGGTMMRVAWGRIT